MGAWGGSGAGRSRHSWPGRPSWCQTPCATTSMTSSAPAAASRRGSSSRRRSTRRRSCSSQPTESRPAAACPAPTTATSSPPSTTCRATTQAWSRTRAGCANTGSAPSVQPRAIRPRRPTDPPARSACAHPCRCRPSARTRRPRPPLKKFLKLLKKN